MRNVAGAVILRNRRVLLLRKRAKATGNLWLFPGGVIKDGETPENGLVREIAEELNCGVVPGTMVKLGEFDGSGLPGKPAVHLVCFLVRLNGCPQLSLEHDDCAWVARDEVLKYKVTGVTCLCLEALTERGLW